MPFWNRRISQSYLGQESWRAHSTPLLIKKRTPLSSQLVAHNCRAAYDALSLHQVAEPLEAAATAGKLEATSSQHCPPLSSVADLATVDNVFHEELISAIITQLCLLRLARFPPTPLQRVWLPVCVIAASS